MKEQWLKLSLQFFSDASTEENTETENTVENNDMTAETTDTEQLTEVQLKLVNDRVNEEMQRRTKAMRQQLQDELTQKQKEADKLRKMKPNKNINICAL
ncbi:phage capsid and scaffold protein [Staphylococcus delphini]|nr:phage capsid and scaffold protein [Staphylococcus delphini]